MDFGVKVMDFGVKAMDFGVKELEIAPALSLPPQLHGSPRDQPTQTWLRHWFPFILSERRSMNRGKKNRIP